MANYYDNNGHYVGYRDGNNFYNDKGHYCAKKNGIPVR